MDKPLLIAGTCWLKDSLRVWQAEQWVRLAQHFDPGTPMLLVDCASPHPMPTHPLLSTIQLDSNVGHLAGGGRDGWGRAFSAALQFGVADGYEWIAFWDADVFFMRSARESIKRSAFASWQVGVTRAWPYPWIEGINFFHTNWLRDSRFVERYDWQNSPVHPTPEMRCEQLIGEAAVDLKLRGRRDEGYYSPGGPTLPLGVNWLTHQLLGVDWLTHSTRPVYEALLEAHGLGLT